MSKGNTNFKARLNAAIKQVVVDLKLIDPRVRRLYTPIWRDRKYRWISPMDSDGLLIKERKIESEDQVQGSDVPLRIGVIVQSEFTTSLTKPNPFGKALVDTLPLGVWVDKVDKQGATRIRLDRVYVLFVLPQAKGQSRKQISEGARENVKNASAAAKGAHILEVHAGARSPVLAAEISKKVRPWLVGAGRPEGS